MDMAQCGDRLYYRKASRQGRDLNNTVQAVGAVR